MKKYLMLILVGLSTSGYGQSYFKVGEKTGDNILYGVVNNDAEYIINPLFNNIKINKLESGDIVFLVEQEKKQGLLNHKGEKIMDIKYEDISISTCYSNYLIAKKENKWGYYSDKGDLLINHKYDSAGEFKNDTAIAYVKSKAYIITINGKTKKANWKPGKVENYYINGCYSVGLDMNIVVDGDDIKVADGKYGVYDSYRNKWVIQQHYQNITFDENSGYYFVQLERKWAFFRGYGKKFSEFKFDSITLLSTY